MAGNRSVGLVDVPTADLEAVLRAVHRGELTTPLTISEVTRIGLQHRAESLLGHLRGLDARAVIAVLVAVLAERRGSTEPRK